MYKRDAFNNDLPKPFPPVDELIRSALRRPAHGAAGLRRGKLKGALPPAAVRALPREQGRVGSGSGRGHGGSRRRTGARCARVKDGDGGGEVEVSGESEDGAWSLWMEAKAKARRVGGWVRP